MFWRRTFMLPLVLMLLPAAAAFAQEGLAGEPVALPGLIQAKAAAGRVELAAYGVAFIRRP